MTTNRKGTRARYVKNRAGRRRPARARGRGARSNSGIELSSRGSFRQCGGGRRAHDRESGDPRTYTRRLSAGAHTDDALRFAERIQHACSNVLADSLAGVILHGSLTLGDYVPGQSDIDVLAIVDAPLTDERLAALRDAVAAEGLDAPAPADVRVVTREVAADPTPTPPMELYIRLAKPGTDTVEVEARHPGERDLVVELSVCRIHGLSLAGAAPVDVIGDVPDGWVVRVGDGQLAEWQSLEYEPRYEELMVFTACRVWRFAAERRHCSKSAAAQWALECDPTLDAVAAALDRRRSGGTTEIEEAGVRRLLAIARAEIDHADAAV